MVMLQNHQMHILLEFPMNFHGSKPAEKLHRLLLRKFKIDTHNDAIVLKGESHFPRPIRFFRYIHSSIFFLGGGLFR